MQVFVRVWHAIKKKKGIKCMILQSNDFAHIEPE